MSSDNQQEIPFFHSVSTSLTGEAVIDMVHAMHGKESIIPASVTSQYLARAGCNISDPNVVKLVSFSTQKLLSEILREAKEHKELTTDSSEDHKMSLVTTANIQYALCKQGIELANPPYLLDSEKVVVVENK